MTPTPGPWRMQKHGDRSDYGPDAYTLWPQGVIVESGLHRADAALIAAAPALRDALSRLLAYFAEYESDYGETVPAMEAARQALAAAEGETR